tara:strand:- start:27927 stop:28040 length:114 start_codon:yes stop_codon:yes gene_type:complete
MEKPLRVRVEKIVQREFVKSLNSLLCNTLTAFAEIGT